MRILHIVGPMNLGGIENFLMNVYRVIDHSQVQFDFLVTREQQGIFDKEINLLGGKIYNIPYIKKVGLLKYIKILNEFFRTHPEYKIVHCHMNATAGLYLPIARINGIPVRIAHGHSAAFSQNPKIIEYVEFLFKKLLKLFVNSNATHYFACGYDAGVWLYGKKIADYDLNIVRNGVNTRRFQYEENIAHKIRNELSITDNTLVIGHVGNMSSPKNHKFLIDVYEALLHRVPNSILCLVGDGTLRTTIQDYVNDKNLTGKVKFLGSRNDVPDLLRAFDIFVMPSIFEGLPVSVIEAQAATLPCILSDRITTEVDMGMGLTHFIGLEQSPAAWAEIIIKNKSKNRNISIQPLIEHGYDIKTTAEWLQSFYLNVLK